ncbi:hypothetical protein [Actinoallomurus bryophytorum]|uniref:hypothetical protein n=1 Tax=Actinoallomurus bryophytorum TaxID=1490222 RepID=UPI0011548857|nr:hypothetical protein [Actinoallomurus bryophytorum]
MNIEHPKIFEVTGRDIAVATRDLNLLVRHISVAQKLVVSIWSSLRISMSILTILSRPAIHGVSASSQLAVTPASHRSD